MKKMLIIILIGFFMASVFTISFTFQISNTFENFNEDDDDDDDDDDNGDGNINNLSPTIQISIIIQQKNCHWKKEILNSKYLFDCKI